MAYHKWGVLPALLYTPVKSADVQIDRRSATPAPNPEKQN
jgi:hypothetical protein